MDPHVSPDHGTRKHALLSASGASRWLTCTPSAKLAEGFPDKESVYAAEGTLAHEIAEIGIRLALGWIDQDEYDALLAVLRFVADPEKNELIDNPLFYYDMLDEAQIYVDYVIEQYNLNVQKGIATKILIEEKVDLTHFIEDGFGTCDTIIIADGVMEVTDLKFGKGVRVSAEDNPQLKLYGLGALRAYELMYDIHTVRLTIVQPRLDAISTWDISAEDLHKWGAETVTPRAKMAYAGEGDLVPGTHCRWCKAKTRCKALAYQNLAAAKRAFAEDADSEPVDPRLLTDDELLEAWSKMPQVEDWLKAVSTYLLDEALAGRKFEGYKIVEGRSNRVWADAENVRLRLIENGFTADEIMAPPAAPKVKGIGEIEKLVGKTKFPDILGDLAIKPKGKPAFVPETDKRPEYTKPSAADIFAADED
jgi:hypothetical protein